MRALRALLTAIAALALAPSALAAEATLDGGVLRYAGGAKNDRIAVQKFPADGAFVVTQLGGPEDEQVLPSPTCPLADPAVGGVVRCAGNVTRVVIETGDGADEVRLSDLGVTGEVDLGPGADRADVVEEAVAFNVVFRGGDGPDTLIAGVGTDTLDGGPGTDVATGGSGTDSCTAETTTGCP